MLTEAAICFMWQQGVPRPDSHLLDRKLLILLKFGRIVKDP